MTEFELNELMIGQTAVMSTAFQIWALATTSLVIAAYMVGNKIDKSLRWTLLVTYTLLAFGAISSWCNSVYYTTHIGQRLIDAGTPYMVNFVVANISLLSMIAAFLVGTIGSIAYMIKTGNEKSA